MIEPECGLLCSDCSFREASYSISHKEIINFRLIEPCE